MSVASFAISFPLVFAVKLLLIYFDMMKYRKKNGVIPAKLTKICTSDKMCIVAMGLLSATTCVS